MRASPVDAKMVAWGGSILPAQNPVVCQLVAFRSAKGRAFAARKSTICQTDPLPKIRSEGEVECDVACPRIPTFEIRAHAKAQRRKENKATCHSFAALREFSSCSAGPLMVSSQRNGTIPFPARCPMCRCAAVVFLLAAIPAFAQEGTWLGKTILTRELGVPITHTDEKGKEVYLPLTDSIYYRVEAEDGDRVK